MLDARVEPVQKPEYFGKLLDFSQISPSSGLFYLNVAEKASFFAFFWVVFWFSARESRLCFRPCGTLARAYVRRRVRGRIRARRGVERGVERAMGWLVAKKFQISLRKELHLPLAPVRVRTTYYRKAVPMSPSLTPAEVSDLATWLSTQTWSEFALSLAGYYAKHGKLSDKQIASGLSMRAKVEAKRASKPSAPAPAVAGVVSAGIYAIGEAVYRVEPSKSSGNLYAKRLMEGASASDWGWSYERGAIYAIATAVADGTGRRLTEAEASEYGKLTGRCVCCGRLLTDSNSIALGIGPVCIKRWF